MRTLDGVGSLAIKALKRALSFAAGRQRKSEMRPAIGASRSSGLAHVVILPPVRNFVNTKAALARSHCTTTNAVARPAK